MPTTSWGALVQHSRQTSLLPPRRPSTLSPGSPGSACPRAPSLSTRWAPWAGAALAKLRPRTAAKRRPRTASRIRRRAKMTRWPARRRRADAAQGVRPAKGGTASLLCDAATVLFRMFLSSRAAIGGPPRGRSAPGVTRVLAGLQRDGCCEADPVPQPVRPSARPPTKARGPRLGRAPRVTRGARRRASGVRDFVEHSASGYNTLRRPGVPGGGAKLVKEANLSILSEENEAGSHSSNSPNVASPALSAGAAPSPPRPRSLAGTV